MEYLAKLRLPKRTGLHASKKRLIDDDETTTCDESADIQSAKPRNASYTNPALDSADSESMDSQSKKKEKRSNSMEMKDRTDTSRSSSASDRKNKEQDKVECISEVSPKKPKRRLKKKINGSTKSVLSDDKTAKRDHSGASVREKINSPVSESNSESIEMSVIENNSKQDKSDAKVTKREKSGKISSKEILSDDAPREKDRKSVPPLKIIGLHIVNCDFLKNHWFLQCVFVKITIMNAKSEKVLSNEDGSLVTKPFEFLKNGTLIAQWNETIIFDDKLIERTKKLNHLIIFFEIIDRNIVDEENRKESPVAWAFIKPIGHKGASNINKPLKLQLYEFTDETNVFNIWKEKNWLRYPSTMNIRIKSVRIDEENSSLNEIKYNFIRNAAQFSRVFHRRSTFKIPNPKSETSTWDRRRDDRACQIPNAILCELNNADGQTTVLKFSKCGGKLAVAAKRDKKYFVIVYKIPELEEEVKLFHHKGIIYEICWNAAGNKLLTSSADSTVCVWNITDAKSHTRQQLQHGSFVYCAKFCDANEKIFASGCYDRMIRIWTDEGGEYALAEELEGHAGYVNSVCFLPNLEIFFSGDSHGVIYKWARGKGEWMRIMEIKVLEFIGKAINDLVPLSNAKRLLVVLRNEAPWTLNVADSVAGTCYSGGWNHKFQSRGCISPCGSFIFSGNDVWKATSGELVASYDPKPFDHHPVVCVDFHPHFNLVALTCGRENIPPILYHSRRLLASQNVDEGFELRSQEKYLLPRQPLPHSESRFKSVGERIIQDIVAEEKVREKRTRNGEFKLWNLLKAMDAVLRGARNGRPVPRRTIHDDEEHRISSVREADDVESRESDVSEAACEVAVEAEVARRNSNLPPRRVFEHEIVESTTSDVESLEEDLGTYTIEKP